MRIRFLEGYVDMIDEPSLPLKIEIETEGVGQTGLIYASHYEYFTLNVYYF